MEVAGYEVTQGPDVIAEMTSFSTDKSSGEGLPPATGCVCVSPLSSTAVALNSFPAMSGRLEGKKKEKKNRALKTCSLFLQSVTPAISLASHGSVDWHTAAVRQWKNHKTDGSFTFLFRF